MHVLAAVVVALMLAAGAPPQAGQPEVTAKDVEAAIDRLGSLEFEVRMEASRTVRRAAPAVALPLLNRAVAGHGDSYVRYRALVLLSGFNDPRAGETMLSVLDDRNDRLRAVAYAYFEHNTDRSALPRLLAALDREESEFVRPALTRALAAYGDDPKARSAVTALALRGQDFFRSVVIEALGDHQAAYALPTLTKIAELEGPLQRHAVMAMGKIGDKRSLETFVALQRTAPRSVQPAVAAAICLVGVNCPSHQGYLASSSPSRLRTRVIRSCCGPPPRAWPRSPWPAAPMQPPSSSSGAPRHGIPSARPSRWRSARSRSATRC
jgi:HEAT repeat protein